jgi:predicted oxidoreductase
MTKPNREQELEKDINILKDKGIACSKCGLICCWLLEHEAELKGIHEERERIRKMVENERLSRDDILKKLDEVK